MNMDGERSFYRRPKGTKGKRNQSERQRKSKTKRRNADSQFGR